MDQINVIPECPMEERKYLRVGEKIHRRECRKRFYK
jgi:hypothetical protein